MAGKRQHYVPRFLQRGFLHDSDEKPEHTWLYRRGAKAESVGIGSIGVKDRFYSRVPVDGQPTLDDLITELESDLGATIRSMRKALPGTLVDAATAAPFVVHLVMRTNHIRSLILKVVESFTNEMQLLYGDSSRLGSVLRLDALEPSNLFSDAVREVALKLTPPGAPSSLAERIISFFVREDPDYFIRHLQAAASPLFAPSHIGLASEVRDAHNRVLLNALRESCGWASRLSTFRWTVEAGEDLILPDAVALAAEADGRLVSLPFTTAKAAEAVVLPISSKRILVGVCPGRDSLDLAHFNKRAAAACSAFFISARSLDEGNLAELIGTASATAVQNAVDKATRMSGTEKVAGAPVVPPPTQAQTFEPKGFSYMVRLADFGDAALAKKISDVIEVVVRELARHLPLHDLDGFTIALDYQRALVELDRGDPSLAPARSSALPYGVGVAMPVTVMRSGLHKEHIVLDAQLAQMIVQSDITYQAIGLNILIKALASVSYSTRFARDAAITFKPDPLTAALHSAVAATPPRWFSARESAFVAPHVGRFHADLVMESMEFAECEVATERSKIRRTDDVGNVTQRAAECVSAVLEHAADWLGHRAGLADGQAFDGDDLPARLQTRGLDRWLELFGRDLAAVYEDQERIKMTVVTRLSQHVDRLLCALGVFVWLDGEDVRCVLAEQGLIAPRSA